MVMQELYQRRAKDFAVIAETLKQEYNRFSVIRVVIFFIGAAIFTLLWS